MEFEGFSALGSRMARMAGRLGTVDPNAADQADLEWGIRASRCLRAMIDAREALITARLEHLIGAGRPAPADATAGDATDPASGADDAGESAGRAGAEAEPSGGGDDLGLPAGSGPVGEGDPRETDKEYQQRLIRARWLRRLPLFAEALEAGVIATAIVDGLAAVLDFVEQPVVADVLADEDVLLGVARTATRASFLRYLRLRVDTVRADGGAARLRRQIEDSFGVLGADDDLGMHQLFMKLDPVRGEQAFSAIRRRVDELQQSGEMSTLRRGQVVAQAICDLICGGATAGSGGVEILVIADLVSLLRGGSASPTAPNDEPCGPCTDRARTRHVGWRSPTASSITSSPGKTAGPPTSINSSPCAGATTIRSTTPAGN